MLRRCVPWLVALAAALHAASYLGHGPCDDDYITYRYARNLVEGHGLVFNPGERVEGFSAPGWMLAVAGALKLGLEPALFSVAVSIAAAGLTSWFVARLWLRRHERDVWAFPAWLVAASPALAWHSIIGLGTVLLAALVAWAFDAWDRSLRDHKASTTAALAFGLAALVRNEAILLALPYVASELRRKRWTAAALALAPLAAWQAFRLSYYGRLVPITYSVKKLALADDLALGLEYVRAASGSSGLLVGLALGLVALARVARHPSAPLRGACVGAVTFTGYVIYVGGDFMPHARFLVPIFPLVAWIGSEGLLALGPPRLLCWAAALAALAWNQVGQGLRSELRAVHEDSERRWEAMGRELALRVAPDTKVALAPIGAFGWVSRLPIVDLLGLTNTAIANAAPDPEITIKGHTRYDADWVLAQRPEIIVIGNGWVHPSADGSRTLVASAWEKTLVTHPRFQSEYLPLQMEISGSYPLIFYWRRDLERPSWARDV
ncbi:MAG: hypothetical protein IT454_11405 [Planctomycetes bacterium]|nr:hypothetical protein [Planctomycetota bacterium]